MIINKRFALVLGWLKTQHVNAETELHYTNPYELLIVVILSASALINGSTWLRLHYFNVSLCRFRWPAAILVKLSGVCRKTAPCWSSFVTKFTAVHIR